MPETAISTPEHTAFVTRMTLGITSARDTAAPSNAICAPCGYSGVCSASDDE